MRDVSGIEAELKTEQSGLTDAHEKAQTCKACGEKAGAEQAGELCGKKHKRRTGRRADGGEHDCGTHSCGCGSCKKGKGDEERISPAEPIILAVALAALIVSFIAPFSDTKYGGYLDFGWIAVALCAPPIFIAGVKGILHGRLTSDLLISMSIVACITLECLVWSGKLAGDAHSHSNIFAAGEVAWLMRLGELLEQFTVNKARSGIKRLVNLTPATAKYRVDGRIIEKPLSEVKVGDEVTVLPNDLISVDGVIISGASAVNEAIMTGESVPVDKKEGDAVYGGTFNGEGALEVRVTRAADEMAVAKLRRLVEEAEGKKAPISKLADRWAGYIVPAALVLAVAIFFLSFFLLTDRNWSESVERAVTMLVVFCPCALALATPTAVAAGLGNASKRGILIKSGGALETLAAADTVAFDKTGTLTSGKLSVEKMTTYGVDEKYAMRIAGAVERYSEHPVAAAVYDRCFAPDLPEATETRSLVGAGVSAVIGGKRCCAVRYDKSSEFCSDAIKADADARSMLAAGQTVVAIIEDGSLIALIALADAVKPGSYEACRALREMGIRTVMLTGDNGAVASGVARKLGIDEYRHSLMPEQKLEAIDDMKKAGRTICMVGDGVNDAPALALADTSVAMGALGSDAAVETAETALMNDAPEKIPLLIKLSRRVVSTVRINIIAAMTVNVIAVALSAFGLLDPITGALVHNLSSVLVVAHSALLLTFGAKRDKKRRSRTTESADR